MPNIKTCVCPYLLSAEFCTYDDNGDTYGVCGEKEKEELDEDPGHDAWEPNYPLKTRIRRYLGEEIYLVVGGVDLYLIIIN